MIDYKKIADNDVGGELDSALSTMKLLVETVKLPEKMITYRTIAAQVNLAASAELETAIKGAETMPEWVNIALSSDGININDSQVEGVLNSLGLTDAQSIIDIGVDEVLMFPSLKAGHLEVARAKRIAGEI